MTKPEPWQRSESGTWRQLPMFLSAREIYHHLNMVDEYPHPAQLRRPLMEEKYADASRVSAQWQPDTAAGPGNYRQVLVPSLVEHLLKRQFEMRPLPVEVENGERGYPKNSMTLNNGHHRVAVALAHAPDLPLPVQTGDIFGDGEASVDHVGPVQRTASFSHLPEDPTGVVERSRKARRAVRGVSGEATQPESTTKEATTKETKEIEDLLRPEW